MSARFDFYQKETYQGLIDRIAHLDGKASARWGRMSVDQMVHHLNLAIGSGLGYYQLEDKSNFLTHNLVKWFILKGLKRFPKNVTTPSNLKVETKFDFKKEKSKLLEILSKGFNTKKDADWNAHCYFGALTRNEWGQLIVIHVDHHLKQFGY